MMINSAPTGCDLACEFHEYTRGAGVSKTFLASQISVLARLGVDGVQYKHTKSIVATSLAVVKCGTPAFGLGTLAMTSRPSSIDMRNALLNMPSGYFLIEMHREEPTESAATRASLFMSNLISRFRRFSTSSTIKRPRVNLKNSSLEFQSCTD